MKVHEIEEIFNSKKFSIYSKGGSSTELSPVAILLGGQPASGKTFLTHKAISENKQHNFFIINGDEYRKYHPSSLSLLKNPSSFSVETQPFSNIFTEKLIEETLRDKQSVIIEGTMRNPQIPLSTSNRYKTEGFTTKAYVIAAPFQLTEIGAYLRFYEEVDKTGNGRLADMSSARAAYIGLSQSVDELYTQKSIDNIEIFSYLADNKIASYKNENGKWNSPILPSVMIEFARKKTLEDEKIIGQVLEKAISLYPSFPNSIQPKFKDAIFELEKIYFNAIGIQNTALVKGKNNNFFLSITKDDTASLLTEVSKENYKQYTQSNFFISSIFLKNKKTNNLTQGKGLKV